MADVDILLVIVVMPSTILAGSGSTCTLNDFIVATVVVVSLVAWR